MTLTLLVVVAVLALTWIISLALSRRGGAASAVSFILALGLATFCGIGFLASFERSTSESWPWHLSYAAIGLGSLITGLFGWKRVWSHDQLPESSR